MSLSLQEGAIFANRYKVVRCIAAGGMGAVYEVIHLETERKRALKVMLAHIVGSQELRDRFKREARVAAQIESEFIVDVFDAGVDEATQMPFLVMELLKGEELGKRLERVGRFSPEETVTFLHQTALALDKTHKANIVHRDLKPENLFLTEREDGAPRIKVLDFGIAKLVADGSTQANATRSVGTPLYMSPEQFKSGQKVSPLSDIYALGMMAYTLVVGEPYWAEEASGDSNVFAFAATVMNGPQQPASLRAQKRGVQLSPNFDAWFRRVTAANPAERFQTATSAIAGLAEAFGMAPLQTGPSISQGTGISGQRVPSGAFATSRANVSAPGFTASTGGQAPVKKPSAAPIIATFFGVLVISAGLAIYFLGFRHRTPEPEKVTSLASPQDSAPAAATTEAPSTAVTAPPPASTAAQTTPPASAATAASSVAATPSTPTKPGKPGGTGTKPPATGKTATPGTPATTPTYSRD